MNIYLANICYHSSIILIIIITFDLCKNKLTRKRVKRRIPQLFQHFKRVSEAEKK